MFPLKIDFTVTQPIIIKKINPFLIDEVRFFFDTKMLHRKKIVEKNFSNANHFLHIQISLCCKIFCIVA
jgi:hypothetical protein